MNRIKDLIKEKCPNGVEFKKYGEVFEIKTGKGITIKDASFDGIYPIISGGTTPMGYYDKFNRESNVVTISRVGANAGFVSFIGEKFYLNDKCFSIIPKGIYAEKILPKFIYYYTKNIEQEIMRLQSEGGVPTINIQKVSNLLIPLPHIDVQNEIINILDKFDLLKAELEAELEARKSQYEFWRDEMFKFDGKDIIYKTIKELCTNVIVPMRDKPKVFDGSIPWCRIEDKEGNYFNTSKSNQFVSDETIKKMNLKVFPTGTVICSCSASIGTYAINTQPLVTNQTFIGLVCGEDIVNKYLFYYMQTQTDNLISLSNSGTIPYISRKKFEDLLVPVPSKDEQMKIVYILDKFEKLTNDITEGLPAEIEARRKQYEYYRNKLLNFEDNNA